MLRFSAVFSAIFIFTQTISAQAQTVSITQDLPQVSFSINGQNFTVARIQDTENQLTGDFTKTSRACPPFCIQPMTVAPGVDTVGELEVLDFLQTRVSSGTGLLIDSRVPDFYNNGAIPGAVNVPFNALESDNPYRDDIMRALGATDSGDGLDFSNVYDLMLYCNGPWCGQSKRAIDGLLDAGYPADRLFYYRGGMQNWLLLGLTTVTPANGG
ncbi:sulfurtransferase [Marivivens niveibacter]|uniref:Sulfurtransferase n=1 Tax=Marivivens niveibacter TaxID=1930667 RepID=A0A251WZU5_9RHOB|nr:rhodanese-like domain-containing protein [Marivivens niveibacter]OUD09856.1 sulfurtransferase [Marivivens niveibacter]